MSKIVITCAECSATLYLRLAEVKRQRKKGRVNFFCDLRCAGAFNNRKRRIRIVQLICVHCHYSFESTTHNKAAKSFCSRSCASAGSVTIYRRSKARENRLPPGATASGLRERESWKYVKVGRLLERRGLKCRFERQLRRGPYVYDLLLPTLKIAVEFDGPSHQSNSKSDAIKDAYAARHGWKVIRVPVRANAVISRRRVRKYLLPHIP